MDIISIGHIIREHIIFPDHASEEVLGSPAAYSSVAMARLGARVGIVTRIGKDMPAHLLEPLSTAGVDMHGMRVSPDEPTTSTRLVYNQQGEKTIEYPTKASPITFTDFPQEYLAAPIFNICTMDWEVGVDEVRKMVREGRTLAMDLGGYGGAHARPVKRPRGVPPGLPALISNFDIVKASDEDCRRALNDPEADDETLGRQILEWGARIFVATRGSRGALVMTADKQWLIPPYEGRVIDPTGGGDTFFAGFLVALLRSGDPEYAGHYGAATALCVIEQTGGVRAARMPDAAAVEQCMKRPTMWVGKQTV